MIPTTNPDYLVHIWSTDPPCDIIAAVPERIDLAVTSSWENQLPSSLKEISPMAGIAGQKIGAATGAISNVLNVYGFNAVVQSFTRQSWISSSPVEINLPLIFDMETDAFIDVVTPVNQLQQLVLPWRVSPDSDILMPPGPAIADPDRGKVSIRIGRFLYIDSVIVVSAAPTFSMRLSSSGHPIAADVNVTIRTTETPARDDLDRMYGLSATNFASFA